MLLWLMNLGFAAGEVDTAGSPWYYQNVILKRGRIDA